MGTHEAKRHERGGAVAELAVALPFVFLIVLGAIDFGRVWTVSSRIASATYAGATYGAQTAQSASDIAGTRAVVLSELGLTESGMAFTTPHATALASIAAPPLVLAAAKTKKDDGGSSVESKPGDNGNAVRSPKPNSLADYDILVARYCECEDEKSVDCDKGVCSFGSGNRRTYVRVRVAADFTTLFHYPGIPAALTLVRETRMRAR